jgi:hypothetical protein
VEDVWRTFRIATQDNADFNLAYIGADFSAAEHKSFDTSYMNELFNYGYGLARAGSVRHKAPVREADATR